MFSPSALIPHWKLACHLIIFILYCVYIFRIHFFTVIL